MGADYFDAGYYKQSPASDPAGPGAGYYRVVRGGGFGTPSACRSAFRGVLRLASTPIFLAFGWSRSVEIGPGAPGDDDTASEQLDELLWCRRPACAGKCRRDACTTSRKTRRYQRHWGYDMHNIAPKGPKSRSPGLPRSGYPGSEKGNTIQTLKGFHPLRCNPFGVVAAIRLVSQGSRCAATLGYGD